LNDQSKSELYSPMGISLARAEQINKNFQLHALNVEGKCVFPVYWMKATLPIGKCSLLMLTSFKWTCLLC